MIDKKTHKLVDYLLILLGLYLIADSFLLHQIRFNYGSVGLAWLDPYFNHWMIGVVVVAFAVWDLRKMRT